MAKYKLELDGVRNTETGIWCPPAVGNSEWDEYQRWLEIEGNTPGPVDPIPEPTDAELRDKSLAEGGYGTVKEQLEIIGKEGVAGYQAHFNEVRGRITNPNA